LKRRVYANAPSRFESSVSRVLVAAANWFFVNECLFFCRQRERERERERERKKERKKEASERAKAL